MKKRHKTLQDYEDILHLPHHVSQVRPQMPLSERAAQFAPFAAVVGHDAAVKEAARYTDQRKELDEMEKTIIDETLREIDGRLKERRHQGDSLKGDSLEEGPEIEIVYFLPDPRKEGGQYRTKRGYVKKLDAFHHQVLLTDETRIGIEQIYSLGIV